MTHPALHTRFCDLVGVRYPIVQTGMGWVAGPRLVAATAEAGGLGILASATMTFDELVTAIAEVRARTDRPFGVNMRTDVADVGRPGGPDDRQRRPGGQLRPGPQSGAGRPLPRRPGSWSCPPSGRVATPRRSPSGVSTRSSPRAARAAATPAPCPTSLLAPAVVDAVGDRVAVIAAGGFFDGRGLVAALAYGASGIAMGTRFLLTQESRVPDEVKRLYLQTPVTGTVVSTAVDGAPQRVIRTDLVDHLEKSGWLRSLPRALANAHAFRKETGHHPARPGQGGCGP